DPAPAHAAVDGDGGGLDGRPAREQERGCERDSAGVVRLHVRALLVNEVKCRVDRSAGSCGATHHHGVTRLVAGVGQVSAKVLAVVPPPNCETAPLSWLLLPRWPWTFAPLLQRMPKLALFTVVVFG